MRVTLWSAVIGASLAALAVSSAPAADAEHGKALFHACAACHNDQPDALGPELKGVFGRKSGKIGRASCRERV